MSLSAVLSEAILSARSDAVIAADRNGIIGFWIPGAERIFGYPRDEAIGRSLDLIIPERLRQRHWGGYRRTMESGRSHYGEGDVLSVPALHKNGTTLSVEFTTITLKDGSGVMIGMAAIMREVTKRFEEVRTLKRRLADATKSSG